MADNECEYRKNEKSLAQKQHSHAEKFAKPGTTKVRLVSTKEAVYHLVPSSGAENRLGGVSRDIYRE